MNLKTVVALALVAPLTAFAEPAIVFDCNSPDSAKQQCSFSIDKERIEKAFEPIEKQAQGVSSPSEAMNLMANAMTIFASLIKEPK